jgi:hypothetical protein
LTHWRFTPAKSDFRYIPSPGQDRQEITENPVSQVPSANTGLKVSKRFQGITNEQWWLVAPTV